MTKDSNTLLTRSQSAEWLHAHSPRKSVAQWHSFLNDNTKKKGEKDAIPFEKTIHNITLYKVKDLKKALDKKRAKVETKRIAEVAEVYGKPQPGAKQHFGYAWKGARVNLITDNHDKGSKDAVSIQLMINHPLRVSALTTAQAKELLAELAIAIGQADQFGY